MILVHRITPFLAGLALAALFTSVSIAPSLLSIEAPIIFVLFLLLVARLFKFDMRSPSFWALLSSLAIFCASGLALYLFFESESARLFLAVFVSMLSYIYMENAFYYYHLQAKYQAYSLEYLTMILGVFSVFFSASALYAAYLFIHPPLALIAIIFAVIVLVLLWSALYVSKIDHKRTAVYSAAGALLITELFLSVSFLPSGFATNAALMCVTFYMFLGLSRAHVLEKLTKQIVIRYSALGAAAVALIAGTSRWT
ncbi:MAG: hypothetical protein ACD_76C00012G0002 [uncultured bacterium]|nr:MAG: hypothetical protein ACD_76C00012G0002 [uncultured bacterium]HBD04942.1 hypothetical protein [Candidatus Uhrbacteria bacterium]